MADSMAQEPPDPPDSVLLQDILRESSMEEIWACECMEGDECLFSLEEEGFAMPSEDTTSGLQDEVENEEIEPSSFSGPRSFTREEKQDFLELEELNSFLEGLFDTEATTECNEKLNENKPSDEKAPETSEEIEIKPTDGAPETIEQAPFPLGIEIGIEFTDEAPEMMKDSKPPDPADGIDSSLDGNKTKLSNGEAPEMVEESWLSDPETTETDASAEDSINLLSDEEAFKTIIETIPKELAIAVRQKLHPFFLAASDNQVLSFVIQNILFADKEELSEIVRGGSNITHLLTLFLERPLLLPTPNPKKDSFPQSPSVTTNESETTQESPTSFALNPERNHGRRTRNVDGPYWTEALKQECVENAGPVICFLYQGGEGEADKKKNKTTTSENNIPHQLSEAQYSEMREELRVFFPGQDLGDWDNTRIAAVFKKVYAGEMNYFIGELRSALKTKKLEAKDSASVVLFFFRWLQKLFHLKPELLTLLTLVFGDENTVFVPEKAVAFARKAILAYVPRKKTPDWNFDDGDGMSVVNVFRSKLSKKFSNHLHYEFWRTDKQTQTLNPDAVCGSFLEKKKKKRSCDMTSEEEEKEGKRQKRAENVYRGD